MTEEQATKAIDDRLAELRDAPDDGGHPDDAATPATDTACAVARHRAIEVYRYSSSRSVPPIFSRLNGGLIVRLPAGQTTIDPDGTSETFAYEETDELFECSSSDCKYEAHKHGPITQAETYLDGEWLRCVGCSNIAEHRPHFEPLRFVWVCAMVQIRDHEPNGDGSASVDFGGAGTFEGLAESLNANHGDVWDCLYRYACLTRIIEGVYPAGALPEEERWFRLDCPDGYGDPSMKAVECERPADLPPKFGWAINAIGHTIDAGPTEEHTLTYEDALRMRDAWLVMRAKRRAPR